MDALNNKNKEEIKINNDKDQITQDISGKITHKPINNINEMNNELINAYNQDLLKQQTLLDLKVIRSSNIMRQSIIITESNIKTILNQLESSTHSSILTYSSEAKDYLTSYPLPYTSMKEFNTFMSQYSNDITDLEAVLVNLTIKASFSTSIGPFSSLDHLLEHTFTFNPLYKNTMIAKQSIFCNDIYQWRKVKGDGNCYYRAVIFAFIEKILLNNNQQLLANLITDVRKCYEDKYILTKINIKHNYTIKHSLTIRILIVIYRYLLQGNKAKAYEIFFKCMINCDHFDYGLILYFRYILYRYIKENETKLYTKDFPVLIGNLLPIEYEKSDGLFLFNEFYENYLLKMYQEAEKIVIYLTPFALCTALNVFLFDLNIDCLKEFKYYGNGNPNADYSIEILNNKFHYELIYNYKDYLKDQNIFDCYKLTPIYQNSVLENKEKEIKKNSNTNIIEVTDKQINVFTFEKDEAITKQKPGIMCNSQKCKSKEISINQVKAIEPLNNINKPQIIEPLNKPPVIDSSNQQKLIEPTNKQQINFSQKNVIIPFNPYIPYSDFNNKLNININSNSQQYPSQPILSTQQISNYMRCSKCSNYYIGTFVLRLCQQCVLNELKSNLCGLYLILISTNKVSFKMNRNYKAAKELFGALFKNYFVLQNISINLDEAFEYINYGQPDKKKHKTFISILNEIKIDICLNCENNIDHSNSTNKSPLILPCDCRFCSPKCQRYFLDQYPFGLAEINEQHNMICVCAMAYDLNMTYQFALIVENSSLPYYTNALCSYLSSKMSSYCMICDQALRKEDLVYLKIKNFPLNYWKLFVNVDNNGYFHSVCHLCYTNSLKTFFCSLCRINHEVI